MSEVIFAPIDCFPLNIGKNDKLVLIKYPKTMNLESLNGKKIDLTTYSTSEITVSNPKDPNSKIVYEINNEQHNINDKIYRPLIIDAIDGSTKIGPQFVTSTVITDKSFALPELSIEGIDQLPIQFAYAPPPQWDALELNWLPIGSLSELPKKGHNNRVTSSANNSSKLKKKEKAKRKQLAEEVVPPSPVATTLNEGTNEKKSHKKAKKDSV